MNKLNLQTTDMVDENIKRIGELFPNCLTERLDVSGKPEMAIDFDTLRQELSRYIVEGNEERYLFSWPDKRNAIRLANAPTTDTLRPCRNESVDFDTTKNLYIEGDNLQVLKLLRENYLGKVKMIYIDPPYNTGNDFVYNDDFAQSADEYIHNSGQLDEEGNRLVANTESNGRFHTDWLNMIYPRLKVAKDLLDRKEGVIFISIDENEVDNLRKICDEIFGESNFISQLIWAAGRKNDSKYISISHEYILCYVRNIMYLKENKIIWREKKQGLDDIYSAYNKLKEQYKDDIQKIEQGLKAWYKSLPDGHPAKDHSHYSCVDNKGIYFADNISWPGGGGPKYEVLHPVTHQPVRVPSRGWITNETTLKQWIEEDRVDFGPNENYVPTLKSYLTEREYSVPYSVFYKDGRASSKRLATLMGDKVFENPKDEEIISRLIDFTTKDNDIILDFFSGSGTFAHASFLNYVKDKCQRHFILVQLPEAIDPSKSAPGKARKVAENAIALLDSLNAPHTICEIGKERIRRAGTKIKGELQAKCDKLSDEIASLIAESKQATQLSLMDDDKDPKEELLRQKQEELKNLQTQLDNFDTGFRVLKLDTSNMEDVYYTPEEFTDKTLFDNNIKPDRTDEDLLFQTMIDLGIELSASIERMEIAGKTVWNVAENYLLACFDTEVNESTITAIARLHPYYFVMRDSSLANDNVADNFEQIFEHYSKDTIRRII